jgi:hypothetical protein
MANVGGCKGRREWEGAKFPLSLALTVTLKVQDDIVLGYLTPNEAAGPSRSRASNPTPICTLRVRFKRVTFPEALSI